MADWQSVWDEAAQKNYYWNPKTNETTWKKPWDLVDGEGKGKQVSSSDTSKEKKAGDNDKDSTGKLGANEEDPNAAYFASKEYYEWYTKAYQDAQIQQSAAMTAASYAAAKKGDRFAELALMPGAGGVDSSTVIANKDYKQMSAFFDVEKYQQDRALDRLKPKVVKKYTRKEINKFKVKKHEKKVASLLQRMGPDN